MPTTQINSYIAAVRRLSFQANARRNQENNADGEDAERRPVGIEG